MPTVATRTDRHVYGRQVHGLINMARFSLEYLYPPIALDAFGVAEPKGDVASRIPEKLVCCMWFESR